MSNPQQAQPGLSATRIPTAPSEYRPRIADSLKFYVYALVDPRDQSIFYIGKGSGERYFHHEWEEQLWNEDSDDLATRHKKLVRIKAIREAGARPRIDVIRHGIDAEETALLIEAALIDCLPLCNEAHGFQTEMGRATLGELERRYGAPAAGDLAESDLDQAWPLAGHPEPGPRAEGPWLRPRHERRGSVPICARHLAYRR